MKNWIVVLLAALLFSCSSDVADESSIKDLEYPEELGMVKRADWGWEPIEADFKTHDIRKITIHHGGVEYEVGKDPVEHVQELQSWSRSEKNWIDIPYHYMIDLDGIIYECRPVNIPGDTNTEYNPETHALICVMGNYEVEVISEEQLNAVINMCVYLARQFNVPPAEIAGHKDYSDMTACPGEDLYKYLRDGTIVTQVKKILDEG